MNDDKSGLILKAIGLAEVELIGHRVLITRDKMVGKLEQNRRETGNVIGKGANRDATELVRKGT